MTGKVITAFIDGACRGNPGPAACATVLTCDDVVLVKAGRFLGNSTNNRAEYSGLLLALEKAAQFEHCVDIIVKTNSQLIARQVRGVYKIKDPEMKRLNDKAQELIAARFKSFKIIEVPRAENNIADNLANRSLDKAKEKGLVSSGTKAEFIFDD